MWVDVLWVFTNQRATRHASGVSTGVSSAPIPLSVSIVDTTGTSWATAATTAALIVLDAIQTLSALPAKQDTWSVLKVNA